mmetsp:Transcript_44637/g.115484  ORF Transcript_44637/g.115484 Transcript_44637/m.115484 type:complete len:233 (-) Transcript_44637:690-1388(-)
MSFCPLGERSSASATLPASCSTVRSMARPTFVPVSVTDLAMFCSACVLWRFMLLMPAASLSGSMALSFWASSCCMAVARAVDLNWSEKPFFSARSIACSYTLPTMLELLPPSLSNRATLFDGRMMFTLSPVFWEIQPSMGAASMSWCPTLSTWARRPWNSATCTKVPCDSTLTCGVSKPAPSRMIVSRYTRYQPAWEQDILWYKMSPIWRSSSMLPLQSTASSSSRRFSLTG